MVQWLDTDYILFTLGRRGVSLLESLAVLFGLLSVFLAGRRKTANFWFSYIYNILLFLLFLQERLYSSMLLQPLSLALTVFGHWRWTHPARSEENRARQLRITILSHRQRLLHLGAAALFTVGWGFLMTGVSRWWPGIFPPAEHPFLDAFVVGMILTAQYLAAQKRIDCWGAWIIVNITNIILYLLSGLSFMPLVSGGYLILALLALPAWLKEWRNQ